MAVQLRNARFQYIVKVRFCILWKSSCTAVCKFVFCYPDDHAPPKQKGRWLACLYTGIPLGIGFGYILGGILGSAYGWRLVFLVEAGVILPVVLFTLIASPIDLRKREGT